MIKNVAIYCRVSTEEQKKFGLSVDDQKNSLTEYCKRNKLKIYDYYIDKGVSAGTISKRKEFVRLLKELDNIDLILFTKLDRFSRNVRDANNLLVELDKHNTAFKAIDEDDIDTSTADGRFIFNLKVNLAEHERNKDSERINRVNKYKYEIAKTVCSGKIAYGYKIESKKIVVDEEKAPHIRELFNYYIKCNNLNETTRWFSSTYEKRSIVSIKRMLKKTSYIGQFVTTRDKILLNDFCPAIIDENTFYTVQKMLERNVKNNQSSLLHKRHNAIPYIFSGLLKCHECHGNLSGKSNPNSKHYYNCRKHEFKRCNNVKCTTESDIENFLLNNIENVIHQKKLNIQSIDSKKNIKKNDNSAIIKSKINKLTDLYMNDLVDIDYYKSEYADLKNQLEKCVNNNKEKTSLKSLNEIEKIEEFLKNDFFELYKKLDNLEKRRLWASIIDYVEIKDKNNMKIVVY